MFKRTIWFMVGAITGVAGSAWMVARVARARQSLTPDNLGRTALVGMADVLEGAGTRLRSPNGQG
ncbi:MAG: hypothetical protein RI637_06395 [Acidimicrobiia bacterium]|nr:hypothetical protein [Acidimicrobiia bacterium]